MVVLQQVAWLPVWAVGVVSLLGGTTRHAGIWR
jgi:hypothetical protein